MERFCCPSFLLNRAKPREGMDLTGSGTSYTRHAHLCPTVASHVSVGRHDPGHIAGPMQISTHMRLERSWPILCCPSWTPAVLTI